MGLNDEYFMRKAYNEALTAIEKGEIPIGAVIVSQNRVIARAYNLTQTLNDVTAHAEMQVFTAAADAIGGKYLKNCSLYVTVEPCVMCAGAAYWTQISRVVYGAADSKRGFSKFGKQLFHPKTEIVAGVMENECSQLMKQFFATKR